MNPNFLCCIGAELKNSTQQTTRMTQVYLYRAFESETLSDMLSVGFFNEAIGILRQDDLLLLYSPNETDAKWTYARVSNVDRDGVVIERIGLDATEVIVNTTGYSNLSGNNLQQIMDNLDSLLTTMNNAFVKKDGTSIMTGPLKMRASESFQCAIAPSWDGVGFFKLNSDDSVTLMASMEAIDGLCPATDNIYNLGKTNYRWKDAHIARVITTIINNGYDINVPVTNGPDTLALKSEVDLAANSGSQLYTTGVWYAKMYSGTTPPASAEVEGRNYADFSQVDADNNPIIVIYTYTSGAWTTTATITPPATYNGYITVTSKIWDISEQTDQQGGQVLWSYNQKTFTPYPKIVSIGNLLDAIYPVGALYIGTQNTCPMTALMAGTTWELVSSGRALWTGNGTTGSGTTANEDFANAPANTTINAGLPNITFDSSKIGNETVCTRTWSDGAMVAKQNDSHGGSAGSITAYGTFDFDASRCSNVYGNSTTAQPPAYVVNVWRRTA